MAYRCKVPSALAAAALALSLGNGCDSHSSKASPPAYAPGKLEQAFRSAAGEFQVPYRMLLAVGLLESGLSPFRQSVRYQGVALSSPLGETAFGISRKALSLSRDQGGDSLSLQVSAYAKWVRTALDSKKLNLNPNPSTPTEVYDWVWQLAQLHRDSKDERRNVRVLFSMELIDLLNRGRMWQDPETQEILELAKEGTPIVYEKLAPEIQRTMTLTTEEGPFPAARYFEMTYVNADERKNKPTHIEVIHCPFSLSACLELQNPTDDPERLRLGAHYIIPSGRSELSGFNKILQVAQHRDVLTLSSDQGEPHLIQNAIVVMLVGDSGHYLAGNRIVINPAWFSDEQLMKLGNLVKNVCPLLKSLNPELDVAKCIKPGESDGVHFSTQDRSDYYRWGNIPDFTESIFYAYLRNAQGLPGNAAFEFANSQTLYSQGQPIHFKVRFLTGAARVNVEVAERCGNGKVVWTVLQSVQVRNASSQSFETTMFYKGPNGNGQQFFRTMVYNIDNKLAGWAVDSIFLKDYDIDPGPSPSLEDCSHSEAML